MRKSSIIFVLLFLGGCAPSTIKTGSAWVESKMATMSVEEKVGQIMAPAYPARFYNENDAQFRRLIRLVKEYHIGGITFWRGQPYEVARMIERLQSEAEIPLLVMADTEWGLSMRVDYSTRFLQDMAIGATGNEEFAYEVGRISAVESRAIGVHVGYAPVMDVNNNPENIIINTRSFGEDPELVSRLGSAYIRGAQENGLYSTAKHFPGHGDTDIDSHMFLPIIHAERERVRSVELVPFQAAVKAGVKCMMVAHITFSQIPEMEGRPATLDPYFIKDILREEMGFKGLIFTDAMGMGGITENYWSGEAAVMAINAGVDMVLIPPDYEVTFRFVVKAVESGRISRETLDKAVRQVLEAKADLGLERKPVFNIEHLEEVLSNPEHLSIASKINDAAMTLVRDDKNVIPFEAENIDTILVVTLTDEEGTAWRGATLNREVAKRTPGIKTAFVDPRSTEEEIAEISTLADSADAVVVGVFVKWRDRKGSISLPDTTVSMLRSFFLKEKPMAVVAFGSPYVLSQIPEVPSYLCAYETVPAAAQSATKAIFGEIPLEAKLPVSIPGLYDVGHGLTRSVRNMELVRRIDDDILEEAYDVLNKAIEDSIFPGAQVAVVRNGELIASRGFGRQTYSSDSPEVNTETIYDLASVTKVAAMTVSAMSFWDRGKLLLDIPVKSYLPEFSGGEKDQITLRHLLTHSGGLHWWTDLWNKVGDKADIFDYIYKLPLDFAPGDSMIYTDLGIMMTGEILETISGKSLDRLARELIYGPLGMGSTMFNPPDELKPRIAPTEIGGGMKRGLIHGDVHDENAYFRGGVSPHAGLFSRAEDLAHLAQMLMNGGIYRHRRYYKPETVRYWTTRQQIPEWSVRALGWTTPADEGSSAGDYFSTGSFGHTGFTGTSFWVDPNREIAIILLTNRVHPTRDRGGMYQVRRDFHNAAMRSILTSMGEELPIRDEIETD